MENNVKKTFKSTLSYKIKFSYGKKFRDVSYICTAKHNLCDENGNFSNDITIYGAFGPWREGAFC